MLDLIVRLLRDWRRGFTDMDIATARQKMAGPHRPGAVITVSKGELNAVIKEVI